MNEVVDRMTGQYGLDLEQDVVETLARFVNPSDVLSAVWRRLLHLFLLYLLLFSHLYALRGPCLPHYLVACLLSVLMKL